MRVIKETEKNLGTLYYRIFTSKLKEIAGYTQISAAQIVLNVSKRLVFMDLTDRSMSWLQFVLIHFLMVGSLSVPIFGLASCSIRTIPKRSTDEARSARLRIQPAFRLLEHQRLDLKSKRANATNLSIGYSSIILNPSKIDISLYSGWNREYEANKDNKAMAFISGPTFEVTSNEGMGFIVDGDLKLANGYWESRNRAASSSRASLCILNSGLLRFQYGSLNYTSGHDCRIFIGGLHALTNNTRHPPSSYKGVYGPMNMADVRIVYGLRADNLLEVIETDDGLLFEDLRRFSEAKGFLAAYVPDHASKSRLIVPRKRLWSAAKAFWVSGGRPSITQMPLMLRISERNTHPPTTP